MNLNTKNNILLFCGLLIPMFCYAQVQKITASDGAATDFFGNALSVNANGTVMIIGADGKDGMGNNSGVAYIFNASSGWSQIIKLQATDASVNDQFGWRVDINGSGNTAIIGAKGEGGEGAIYIFENNSGWGQLQKLTANDGASGDEFGYDVAISSDGNYAIVGAVFDDDDGASSGSAYIFYNNGGTWEFQEKLTASDAASGDEFGYAVDINADGTYVIIGARQENSASGAAYVFQRSGSSWTEDDKLVATDAASGDEFGVSVSIEGTTAAIGAWLDDDKGTDSGAVYIFSRSGMNWSENHKISPSDGQAGDYFGWNIDLSGTNLAIGAWGDDDQGANAGSAYIFNAGDASQIDKFLASDGASGDELGRAVTIDISNTAFAVGAIEDDDKGSSSGSVYILGSSALPVELIAFDLSLKDDEIFLEWVTSQEVNNKGFDVEYLIDNQHWLKLGFVPAKNVITDYNHYTFAVKPTQTGSLYFRLKQIDHDGTFNYSQTKSILVRAFERKKDYKLFPIPVNNTLYVQTDSSKYFKLNVFDTNGRFLYSFDQPQAIDVNNWAKGMYFILIEDQIGHYTYIINVK